MVLINFAEYEMKVNVTQVTSKYFTKLEKLHVVLAGADSNYSPGDLVSKTGVVLRQFDAVILNSSATSVTISLTVLFVAVCRFIIA